MKKTGVAILGSTGSIGTQALEVIEAHPDHFSLQVLTAHRNANILIDQALRYMPKCVVIVREEAYEEVHDALVGAGIQVYSGEASLAQVVVLGDIDIVLTALVGYAGLKPTLAAIVAKKDIALANKETLVVAGELVTRLARENGVNIYPVDSEHSGIFQCLLGEQHTAIEKIYLTASGGPFRGWNENALRKVTPQQVLKHPNWPMGAKITVESASLMSTGFEMIEAKWLFNLRPDQIDVIVHPQSIVHSLVQFQDGTIKAQIGLPDMKLPIQFALTCPERVKNDFPRFNFMDYPQLTFEKPDRGTFKNLDLAYEAMELGGTAACALNAANEVTVQAFLELKIGFLQVGGINEQVMRASYFVQSPVYEDYLAVDKEARDLAELIVLVS